MKNVVTGLVIDKEGTVVVSASDIDTKMLVIAVSTNKIPPIFCETIVQNKSYDIIHI